jgi:hypothetical protein
MRRSTISFASLQSAQRLSLKVSWLGSRNVLAVQGGRGFESLHPLRRKPRRRGSEERQPPGD